jgi:hypothetical protein
MAHSNRARKLLTHNVKKIIGDRAINAVALEAGIPQRTLWNCANAVEANLDLRLSTIDAVAEAFGLNAADLLQPAVRDELLGRIIYALKHGAPAQRAIIEAALSPSFQEIAERAERRRKATQSGNAGG